MNLKYLNAEQRHQIEMYRWIRSERVGHDIGERCTLDWVYNYAAVFREWAENIPTQCIQCGLTGCQGPDTDNECCSPFNDLRLNLMQRRFPSDLYI